MDDVEKPKNWSPYGCHYYPDPEAFPSPRLDSLPTEPLKRGEQYYLDLAGNIRKGPVGVGYTCYCAPLFRHLEARLEKDKRELQKAQVRLGQRVAGLEQKMNRGGHGRRSERVPQVREAPTIGLSRSRSLEMLDQIERSPLQATRSMDELDPPDDQRPSVKELVARIQKQQAEAALKHPDSESSDDEDSPLRMVQNQGPMGSSNMAVSPLAMPNYENVPNDIPRSRSCVYSPTSAASSRCHVEPVVKIQENYHKQPSTSRDFRHSLSPNSDEATGGPQLYKNKYFHQPAELFYGPKVQNAKCCEPNVHYSDVSARFAKLRTLDNSKLFEKSKTTLEGSSRMLDSEKMFESTTRMLENPQDVADRDTNNDSGYSTKVYGSSKGNSPSLSGGQMDADCIGASSLV